MQSRGETMAHTLDTKGDFPSENIRSSQDLEIVMGKVAPVLHVLKDCFPFYAKLGGNENFVKKMSS